MINTHSIKVIGHQNPDTDSICAAIAYSRLKNQIDPKHPCKPCRAGSLNRETEFVLQRFQVPVPQLYASVSPQIRNIDIRLMPSVDGEMSMRQAWTTIRDQRIDTLRILDGKRLKGLLTVKDIATANMDEQIVLIFGFLISPLFHYAPLKGKNGPVNCEFSVNIKSRPEQYWVGVKSRMDCSAGGTVPDGQRYSHDGLD